jgi:hypothetical protein
MNIGISGLIVAAVVLSACNSNSAPAAKEIESHTSGDMVITLSSETGQLAQGKNTFYIAFRSAGTNQPVDAGTIMLSASMTMPGMAPMVAPIEITPAGKPGQYIVKAEFGMSGSFGFEVRWDGPAGRGSTTFHSSVR